MNKREIKKEYIAFEKEKVGILYRLLEENAQDRESFYTLLVSESFIKDGKSEEFTVEIDDFTDKRPIAEKAFSEVVLGEVSAFHIEDIIFDLTETLDA